MSTTRVCGLCHRQALLCKSHLMPKALYRLLRSDGAANPNPFSIRQTITQANAAITSRQAAKHLLCRSCQNVLSAKGEKYVLANCLRQDVTFPLRDKVLVRAEASASGQRHQARLILVAQPHKGKDRPSFARPLGWTEGARCDVKRSGSSSGC